MTLGHVDCNYRILCSDDFELGWKTQTGWSKSSTARTCGVVLLNRRPTQGEMGTIKSLASKRCCRSGLFTTVFCLHAHWLLFIFHGYFKNKNTRNSSQASFQPSDFEAYRPRGHFHQFLAVFFLWWLFFFLWCPALVCSFGHAACFAFLSLFFLCDDPLPFLFCSFLFFMSSCSLSIFLIPWLFSFKLLSLLLLLLTIPSPSLLRTSGSQVTWSSFALVFLETA